MCFSIKKHMDIFPSLPLSFQLSSRPQGRLLRRCRRRCREAPARRPIRARLANAGQELLVRVYLLGPVAIESSAYTRTAGGWPVGRPICPSVEKKLFPVICGSVIFVICDCPEVEECWR